MINAKTLFLMVFLVFCVPAIAVYAQNSSDAWPADLKQEIQTAAIAIADNWVDDRNPENQDWAWGEGVLSYGLIRTALWSNNDSYYNFVEDYILYHQNNNATIQWSDHTTPAIAGFYISSHFDGDQKIFPITKRVIDYIMNAPRTGPQGLLIHLGHYADDWKYGLLNLPDAWIDSLFHITPSLVMYSRLTGNNEYINEAATQIKKFIQNLQDPQTHLFAHAYYDYPDNKVVPAFSNNEFWARGNSWVLAALVELLAQLPMTHPEYFFLENTAIDLEQALREHQGDDGRFHTLVTKSNSYYETAGTALILYAMAYGHELGLFGQETRAAVLKGARGLLDNTLDWHHDNTQANVTNTSIGTNPTPGLYRFVPRGSQINYGVGAWLMFASILAD
ncbi:MAG: hypothetical protein GY710_03135 [Desulfobacteraceae bacterium]|nr:hypothetical protein [Desulfobacteraceae bacterium]